MIRVLTLLSTYNGERYLRDQLDSLLNQNGVDITILIRDDESTDRTLEIVHEYERKTGKIILIKGTNCGSCNSFLKLMKEALKYSNSYDYFAFCDQDDVWLQNKIRVAVDILESKKKKDFPSLYMSAYQMVDEKLNKIETKTRIPIISLPAALASNCATGCTMVFNTSLLSAATGNDGCDVIMHDYWVYLTCLVKNGFVYYDSVPHILYRQHGSNVIGGQGDSFVRRWYIRFKKVFKRGDYFKSKLSARLLSIYGDQMCSEDYVFLKKMTTSRKLSSKIFILKCKDFWNNNFDNNVKNLGLLITGKM